MKSAELDLGKLVGATGFVLSMAMVLAVVLM
jgi:hypothetical protein